MSMRGKTTPATMDREAQENATYNREFDGVPNPWIPDAEDIGAESEGTPDPSPVAS